MSKKFTQFEDKIHNALENYELPYEAGDWGKLESKLDNPGAGQHWIVALVAAAFFSGIAGFAVYKYSFNQFDAAQGTSVARFENLLDIKNASSLKAEDAEVIVEETNTYLNSNPSASETPSIVSESNENAVTVQDTFTTASENGSSNASNAVSKPENNSKSLSVKPSMTSSCAGGEIEFSALNGPIDGSYLWNFGDGNFSNKPNPKHKYIKPGVYDVSLSVTSKKDGQISTTVMNDLITIHPSPSADFEWDFINTPEGEPTIKIVNTSENASAFAWKFNDGSTSNVISPVRSYSDKGKQAISLEVSNEWGCVDSKVKYVLINHDYNLNAPSQFNPKADVFMPEALKQGKMQFKLTVYNGEVPVYETNNKSKGWDGKLPGGQLASPGTEYPWIVIIYNETTKEEKYFSGIVKILP